jgi:hypothetical protein
MVKIALCLSGQFRSAEKGLEYLKRNLFDVESNYVDVFVHTWGDLNPNNNGPLYKRINDLYGTLSKEYGGRVNLGSGTISPPFRKDMFEDYRIVDTAFPAVNTISMFYSIDQANKSRFAYGNALGVKYDVVIRSRFDYALNLKLGYDQVKEDTVYVPNDRMTLAHDFCADMFAYGTPKTMTKYAATFANIELLHDAGVPVNGEHLLSANLRLQGLTGIDKMVYVDMDNPFPPGKYNCNRHSFIRDDFAEWNPERA